jgi:hypothetical protein
MRKRADQYDAYRFATLKSAVRAFNNREARPASPEHADTRTDPTTDRKNDNPSAVP